MALDSGIDKTAKASDVSSLSSVNLNSVSDKPGFKTVQIADDGVFDRNRGHNQPNQGGRAHPFSNTGDAYKEVTGKDAPVTPAPYVPFKDHAAAEAEANAALIAKQQGIVNAAVTGRIQGNAIAVGFADNAKRRQDLSTHWNDLIDEQNFLVGLGGDAARVGLTGAGAFAMGTFAHGRLQNQWRADRKDALPVVDTSRTAVETLQKDVQKELTAAQGDPARATEAAALQKKSAFLREYIHGERNTRLGDLSEFNKEHPAAFSAAERNTMKVLAESDLKLAAANGAINAGSQLTGRKALWDHGITGLKSGLAFIAGSYIVNFGLKQAARLLPEDSKNEADRILTQSTQESFVQGLVGASPIRSLNTRMAIGAGAWLAGREEKMTWTESIVSTAGLMATTAVVGLATRQPLLKTLEKEASIAFVKTPLGAALAGEAAAFGIGRAVHMIPGLGSSIPELQNASTSAWNSMKTDSEKMNGSSFHDAVKKFDDLGESWRGVLATYQRDIVGDRANPRGIYAGTLALAHGDQPLNNWQNIVINGRTAMALSEAVGDTVLKSGLTGDSKGDLQNTYIQQSSDEKPVNDLTVIAPNQGDLDLTSRAAKNYMTALALADVTMANMKKAQKDGTDTSGQNITDAQIQALAEEKAKMVTEMREKIFRSAPGASAHDIKDIVESSDGVIVGANKFKLTDYANDDPHAFGHMVNALEDKAYAARDGWLPGQAAGPNADISREYVAKIFRDAAVMRLAHVNAELETQTAHSTAPDASSVTNMLAYLQNSDIGRQQDPAHANRDAKDTIAAARQLDPNNPDLKAIQDEYDKLYNRVAAFNANYMSNHDGLTPDQDSAAKLRATLPANAPKN